jgi:hypothetical protein
VTGVFNLILLFYSVFLPAKVVVSGDKTKKQWRRDASRPCGDGDVISHSLLARACSPCRFISDMDRHGLQVHASGDFKISHFYWKGVARESFSAFESLLFSGSGNVSVILLHAARVTLHVS